LNRKVPKITARRYFSDAQIEPLKGTFLDENSFETLLTEDADVYSADGALLLKFRKAAIPVDLARLGSDHLQPFVRLTEARGVAAGTSKKRTRSDGTTTNTTTNPHVETGAAGYMDQNAMVRYCRMTALTHEYFEDFKESLPFIHHVDRLYEMLCPEAYNRQLDISRGTNRNYVIEGTTFTTVTVNRNFQTAVHKDSGDFPHGFGNLTVYREGSWTGSYFCLPEFKLAVDMQNGDMLFVDVHRWHGNTPFVNFNPAPTPFSTAANNPKKDMYQPGGTDLRMSFVMYYREFMIACKQPKDELRDVQNEQGGFLKL
jgi:hypothetical protein